MRIYSLKVGLVSIILIHLILLTYDITGYLINSGDYAWPLSYLIQTSRMVFTWDESINYGYEATRQVFGIFPWPIIFYLLEKFSVSNVLIQNIFYLFLNLYSLLGVYKITNLLLKDEYKSIISSIIYTFGATSVILTEPSIGNINTFYYSLPFVIYLNILFIATKDYRYIIYILLSPIGLSYTNPAFLINTIIFSIIILYVYIKTNVKIKNIDIIKNTLLLLIIYILLNINGLLPFIFNFGTEYSSASNISAGLGLDIEVARNDSLNVLNALVGMGYNFWAVNQGQDGWLYTSWGWMSKNPIIVTINGFLLYIYIFCVTKKNYHKHLLLALIFSIIIISGLKSTYVFDLAFEYLYSSNFYSRLYRSVYIKFGAIHNLLIAMIFSISMMHLINYKIRFKLAFVLILLLLITYPKLTLNTYREISIDYPSQKTKIPNDYFDFTKNHSGSIVILPYPITYNIALRWEKNSYIGAEFIRSLWQGSLITDELIRSKIYNCLLIKADCSELLDNYNINYIMIRKDVDIDHKSIWNRIDSYTYKKLIDGISNNNNYKNYENFVIIEGNKNKDYLFNIYNSDYSKIDYSSELIIAGVYKIELKSAANALIIPKSGKWYSLVFQDEFKVANTNNLNSYTINFLLINHTVLLSLLSNLLLIIFIIVILKLSMKKNEL
jgi:hypothetical protein